MRLLRWLSAVVVAFVLVGAFPVVAQGIPDEATRARVADRLDECVDMWRQLVPMGAYASEYSGTQGMRKFLAHWQERGDPIVSTIQRYIRMCRSLADLANESGRRCEDLAMEVHATGVPTNAVTRHAEHYLGPDGGLSGDQRRAVEEYLRTCVTVYAAVLDGRDPDDVVASRRQETPRDPVASSAGPGPLHGSIAFSQDDDGAYAWGIAWSFDSSAGAEVEALGQCREYGGTRCAEAGWFQEACGALAIGDGNGYGTGWGATTGEAGRDALAQCRVSNDDCRIEVARCAQSEEAGGRGRQQEADQALMREPAIALDPQCADIFAAWREARRSIGILDPRELPSCWREIAERPGCHIFGLINHRPVAWSGECSGGAAAGQGELAGGSFFVDPDGEHPVGSFKASGMVNLGKKRGRWIFEYADELSGSAAGEGSFQNGVRNGRWVYHGQYGEDVIDFDPDWIRQYPD